VRRLFERNWLGPLVEDALAGHVPAQALARLPADLAGGSVDPAVAARILVARSLRPRPLAPAERLEDAFAEAVRRDVTLVLELGVVRGEPFDPPRARAAIATALAGALDQPGRALAVGPGPGSARDVARALRAAGRELRARFFPPGDPVHGLPLYPGTVAVLRRRIARVAAGQARAGRLEPAALERHRRYAVNELVLLAETLSGLLLTAGPVDRRAPSVRNKQMARLGLSGADLREARRRVASPRSPQELAQAAPEAVRPFLLEQLLLAQLRTRLTEDPASLFCHAFAEAAGLDAQAVLAAQVEAAAQSGDHQIWFEAFEEESAPLDWQAVAEAWDSVADTAVDRVSTAVTDNLGALVTEIRETGELGVLLAKASAGQRLSADEKKKIRAQLVDLAKAVPALAIFAAPGGAILLPVLAKLLPFNLLPSAWEKVGQRGARPLPPPGPATPALPPGPVAPDGPAAAEPSDAAGGREAAPGPKRAT